MDAMLSRKELEAVFDPITRDVTRRTAGIELYRGNTPPAGELYTVCTAFERGFAFSLSLCAEASLFFRLTRRMMGREDISFQDVEDFAKEYFNVLCGNIAVRLFQATQVASRFAVPVFCAGRYQPDGYRDHLILSYTSDENENAQLIHYSPIGQRRPEPSPALPQTRSI